MFDLSYALYFCYQYDAFDQYQMVGYLAQDAPCQYISIRYQYLHFDFLLRHILEGSFVWNIAPVRQRVQKGYLLYQVIP